MTDDARALELYQTALSLVDAKGRLVTVGLVAYMEYRGEGLSIRYYPSSGHLEVWHKRKMLAVNKHGGVLAVRHYVPGPWEEALEDAARGFRAGRRKH